MTVSHGLSRWRGGLLVVVAVTALLPVGITRWARGRDARALATRSAVSTAAYLALVTPAGRTGAGYDLSQLLIRARALEQLSGLHERLEVYHGTAPLVHATAPPLSRDLVEGLRRQPAVRWTGRTALAPLFDHAGWDVVGAVEADTEVPEGALGAWLVGAVALALVTGVVAARALGGPPAAAQLAARRYVAAAGLLALVACLDVQAAARNATNLWLRDTRILLEEAAAHAPQARSAASLATIAREGEVVTGDSAGRAPRRREVAGLPRATVAVRLAPGRWAELRTAPAEAATTGWLLATAGLALLGALGMTVATWGVAAAARPRPFHETTAAWGFLAPSALHLALFSFGPLAFAVYLSLHDWGLMDPVRRFVGLANYAHLLEDPLVWASLGRTLVYTLSVPVSMALALAVALALNRPSLGARLLRTAFFLPSVPSLVAIALVWQGIYRPDHGVMNRVLSFARLGPVDWLGDPQVALAALMVVSVWAQLGWQMTVFLAGLQQIPQAYDDAARVDGANAWQRFWRVTFPLLRPVRLFVLVTGVVAAFQLFTLVYVLTGGGPLHATAVVVFRSYETAWEFRQFGGASALALLGFLLLAAVTTALVRLFGPRRADA
jgi:ABC-type sugar transport system permease subunit